MFKKIVGYFDKLEDRVRNKLSHHPVIYAFIGGTGVVLFWRGIWHLADDYGINSWWSLLTATLILLITGTFVSFFIGESILMSGLKEEKRIDQKTEQELFNEESRLKRIRSEIDEIRKMVEAIEEIKINVLKIKAKLEEKNK